VDLKADSGLGVDADGIYVDVACGLELTSDGVKVNIDAESTLGTRRLTSGLYCGGPGGAVTASDSRLRVQYGGGLSIVQDIYHGDAGFISGKEQGGILALNLSGYSTEVSDSNEYGLAFGWDGTDNPDGSAEVVADNEATGQKYARREATDEPGDTTYGNLITYGLRVHPADFLYTETL
jgi:hypothetical protein